MLSLLNTIQARAATLFFAGLLALILTLATILSAVVEPTFSRLERREAQLAGARVGEAVRAELDSLDKLVRDWASWDDSVAFAREWNDAYAQANLQPSALHVLGIDLMLFTDADGRVIWSGRLAGDDGDELLPAEGLPIGLPVAQPALVHVPRVGSRVIGLWRWQGEVMLVATRPITDTTETLPPQGAIVMARRLDETVVEALAARLRLNLTALRLPEGAGSTAGSRSAPVEDVQVTIVDDRTITTTVALRDIRGRPALVLEARQPRDLMAAARETLNTAWGIAVTAILAIVGLLGVTLQVLIVRPLLALKQAVARLGDGQETEAAGLPVRRRDEIGSVARAVARMHGRISHLAHHDVLTGLPNRLSFATRARGIMARAQADGLRVAAMVVDLDRFKPVNDTYGHDAGDLVLRQAADRMTQAVRDSDVVSRVGGDEFVVLCAVQREDQAAEIADRIVQCLALPFHLADGRPVEIGCSIGVTVCGPDDRSGLDHLLALADQAMYDAKRSGRGQWRCADMLADQDAGAPA
ncbi:diguanylate cyclase domain-containing protein [Caenispirillum bisanense]|uniref:diguanylate cyclase domain-containing protein n=1 Tax=Caenispirillum bisanense TaxID=414052 RepID=UPI0031D8FC0C